MTRHLEMMTLASWNYFREKYSLAAMVYMENPRINVRH
jgi:hypothetical protein